MSIKEKPLIDAVSNSGPLPNFLFSTMFGAGFFALLMAGVFGAVTFLFQGGGRGLATVIDALDFIIIGAITAQAFCALILLLVLFRSVFRKEEGAGERRFVAGGIAAIIVTLAMAFLAYVFLRPYLLENASLG